MKKSAGLVLIKNNKILLCHPTNAPWKYSFSIPKGGIEKFEDPIQTAIRETFEEIGILIEEKDIQKEGYIIDYKDKKGKLYKKVYYYLVYLQDNNKDIIPKEQLQLDEIDYAAFYTKDEAKDKIFSRFINMLDFLK